MDEFMGEVDPSVMKGETPEQPERFDIQSASSERNKGENGKGDGFGGMGSSDVKLQYIDDNASSYPNIFNQAKTDISEADQTRLIETLKSLSQGGTVEEVVDMDEVLRYFVVHNFVVNGDSYTGSMIHNYYLYEEDGRLSMLPWDYNLAFGTFQGSSADSAVNDPIDTPLSVTGEGDRPMIDWIFADEEYTALYHQYFEEFLDSVDVVRMIDTAAELIAPYVKSDPSKFYTYEEFEAGVETLRVFCQLRAESVRGQLDGTIPSTSAGQEQDGSALIDASHITVSDMGSMNMGGGFGGEGRGDKRFNRGEPDGEIPATGEFELPEGVTLPEGMEFPQMMSEPERVRTE